MIIGKTFKFCAAHFLPGHPKCGEIHGHDYSVTVELTGEVDPITGMVCDFGNLSNEMEIILGKLDHTFLNKTFPLPTCENLCEYFYSTIASDDEIGKYLYSVSVQEGMGGYAKKKV